MERFEEILKKRLDKENYQKIKKIKNVKIQRFIAKYIDICNPESIFVSTGSEEEIGYIREMAKRTGEEKELAIPGHTVHFDGYHDQARDKENTKILVPEGYDLGPYINTKSRKEGLEEIHRLLKNIMQGHTLYILFFSLGPSNSEFSIPCIQLTDSAYVAHSENILYRQGYEDFLKLDTNSERFFKFVHSQGELDERKNSKNIENRRIYIDTQDNTVYSVNTQYGGNTIGLKKLAMRLSINLASKEGWLTEHMFIMGVHGPKSRVSHFAGAFPSLCGKTSTSMVQGESIVGDDIAFLRRKEGKVRAVNVEKGIFGIIKGINSKDDPLLWKALNSPGDVIFSNILVTEDKKAYWMGKDGEVPDRGYNFSGRWWKGKKDAEGREIPPSHPNARFTLELRLLENMDSQVENPEGVLIKGIIYGGRDSDTWPPVEESFDWVHGIITKGASLESETTAATLGKEGIRKHNPMSNLDFLSIPIGKYIENNINFGFSLKEPPLIFGVNYFLKDEKGSFLNDVADKRVWLKWMELRVHRDVDAIKTPTGLIPEYKDLKELFKKVLNKDYPEKNYVRQFTLRIPENLAKIERIKKIYTKIPDTPPLLFEVLEEQKERLLAAQKKFGDYVPPERFKR